MVKDTLLTTVALFRPTKSSTNARTTFSKTLVKNVKLSQSSSSWTTDTTGATQSRSGILFYNIGTSSEYPAKSPLFKEGDFITTELSTANPPNERFVVKSVTVHTFKGQVHHYEVVLV